MRIYTYFKRSHFTTALASITLLGGQISSLEGGLLLGYSDGTVQLSGESTDLGDDRTFSSGYYSSNYFGSFLANPFATVSVNGNIYFGEGDGDGDYFIQLLGMEGINRVAPLWGDLKLGTSGQVIDQLTDDFYAVTWVNLVSENGYEGTATFQAIFFEQNTTLNSINFLTGDIVFSYGDISLYANMPEVIVGLGSEPLGLYAGLPGYNLQGWLSADSFNPFPVADDQYVLFRPDGLGNYNVSLESVIPEPGSYAVIASILALGLVGCRRHMQKKKLRS